jgi:hypothetical protein
VREGELFGSKYFCVSFIVINLFIQDSVTNRYYKSTLFVTHEPTIHKNESKEKDQICDIKKYLKTDILDFYLFCQVLRFNDKSRRTHKLI